MFPSSGHAFIDPSAILFEHFSRHMSAWERSGRSLAQNQQRDYRYSQEHSQTASTSHHRASTPGKLHQQHQQQQQQQQRQQYRQHIQYHQPAPPVAVAIPLTYDYQPFPSSMSPSSRSSSVCGSVTYHGRLEREGISPSVSRSQSYGRQRQQQITRIPTRRDSFRNTDVDDEGDYGDDGGDADNHSNGDLSYSYGSRLGLGFSQPLGSGWFQLSPLGSGIFKVCGTHSVVESTSSQHYICLFEPKTRECKNSLLLGNYAVEVYIKCLRGPKQTVDIIVGKFSNSSSSSHKNDFYVTISNDAIADKWSVFKKKLNISNGSHNINSSNKGKSSQADYVTLYTTAKGISSSPRTSAVGSRSLKCNVFAKVNIELAEGAFTLKVNDEDVFSDVSIGGIGEDATTGADDSREIVGCFGFLVKGTNFVFKGVKIRPLGVGASVHIPSSSPSSQPLLSLPAIEKAKSGASSLRVSRVSSPTNMPPSNSSFTNVDLNSHNSNNSSNSNNGVLSSNKQSVLLKKCAAELSKKFDRNIVDVVMGDVVPVMDDDIAASDATTDVGTGLNEKGVKTGGAEAGGQGGRVTFDDIAANETAKRLLREAVLLPLLLPELFTGIRAGWKGVLLFGPPGTGKTMLAKAVACSSHCTFFSCSSSSLVSKFRGESEKIVSCLFHAARLCAPSLLFLDEVDALIGVRGVDGEHEASRRMKTEFFTQIDGLSTSQELDKRIIVLAATNCPWDLDTAILRRLEKRVYVPLPDLEGRKEQFKLAMRGIEVDEEVDFMALAERTEGYSGADVHSLCREACMGPMRRMLAEKSPTEMQKMRQLGAIRVPKVLASDFWAALSSTKPSVSAAQIQQFEAWNEQLGYT